MIELKPGDIINIAVVGARVVNTDAHDVLVYRFAREADDQMPRVLPLNAEGLTIEHAMPEITPGDVLTDGQGGVWFAQRYFADFDKPDDWAGCNEAGWRTVLVPLNGGPYGDGSGMRPEEANDRRAPFTVVHHEDEREMPS